MGDFPVPASLRRHYIKILRKPSINRETPRHDETLISESIHLKRCKRLALHGGASSTSATETSRLPVMLDVNFGRRLKPRLSINLHVDRQVHAQLDLCCLPIFNSVWGDVIVYSCTALLVLNIFIKSQCISAAVYVASVYDLRLVTLV